MENFRHAENYAFVRPTNDINYSTTDASSWSSNLTCTKWNRFDLNFRGSAALIDALSSIILILALVGNGIGLLAAAQDKPIYVRVVLTRAFYTINLCNCLFMFLYPVLDMAGQIKLAHFWAGPTWNFYMSRIHFPLAKAFVNSSFFIYVLLAVSQLVATRLPHAYKIYFSIPRIKWMICSGFAYMFVWFLPSGWWFRVTSLTNLCSTEPESIIYVRELVSFESDRQWLAWVVYGIMRELLTKFIPVLLIAVLKLTSRSRVSRIIFSSRRMADPSGCTDPTGVTLKKSQRINPFKSKGSVKSSLDLTLRNGVGANMVKNSELLIETMHKRILDKKVQEHKTEVRMLAILMLEFVLFLFPVSIYIIAIDFFSDSFLERYSAIGSAICTMLEYLYTTLTFYLNTIFNPGYRKDMKRALSEVRFYRDWKLTKILTSTVRACAISNRIENHPP